MFGKKNKTNRGSGDCLSHNYLVEGSELEGNVISHNDFRIDGMFVGNLHCKATVIVGPNGKFIGDISCEKAIIEGHLQGTCSAIDVLEVCEGAVIEGDVKTGKLIVHSGSVFDVKCNMSQNQEKESVKAKQQFQKKPLALEGQPA